MTEITDQQKREIKESIETLATQYTDFVSLIWDTLGLSPSNTIDTNPITKHAKDKINKAVANA